MNMMEHHFGGCEMNESEKDKFMNNNDPFVIWEVKRRYIANIIIIIIILVL